MNYNVEMVGHRTVWEQKTPPEYISHRERKPAAPKNGQCGRHDTRTWGALRRSVAARSSARHHGGEIET